MLAVVLAVSLGTPSFTYAVDFPSRPIRVIVGSAAGGGNDFVVRTLAPKVSAALGQPIVVDNRGGAAGLVASELVAKSAPDGYTLLLVFANFATFPSLQKKLGFDPQRDLIPISNVATSPLVLMVQASFPAKSVAQLIELAKQGKTLNYASPGVGSMGHLAAELFQSMAGIEMAQIPYRGGGPAIMGLLSGDVQLYFSTPPAALAQMKGGKLRALGVTGSRRSAFDPAIPTISESGLNGYDVNGWVGLFAPAGTPKSVVDGINHAFAEAAKDPEIQKALANEGVTAVGNLPAEFAAELQTDFAKWKKVIAGSNIQLE
jgi:tripartite-type tricarboxylate transporter receptor subunit TctC